MKQLFNGSRIGYEENGRLYVQGDYTPWYNEDEDWIEGQDCPLVYKNLELIQIDNDGLWLEQKGKETLLQDNTWYLYETDCTGVKENYLDAEILKKELGVEEEIKEEWTTLTCSLCGQRFLYHTKDECQCSCGATLNLFPDDVKILLAPTLDIAKTIQPDITIEAEYGDETIKGSLYTSAHHGKNQGNPAPCIDDNIPVILEGTILGSHIDLDFILGCGKALGLYEFKHFDMMRFRGIASRIDIDGPHHINKENFKSYKEYFDAYWAWNESRGKEIGNAERIVELKDIRQTVLESLSIIEKIVKHNDEKLIEKGKEWAKNIQEATEKCLKKETKYYRLFSTNRVFCGASYYSPQQKEIIPAIISYNEIFKAITLSFEDSGKKFKADEIMVELFGSGAGGKSGIAGTPRGKEFTFEDTKKVILDLINLYEPCQCSNCLTTFGTDEECCPVCGNIDIY